MVLLCSAALAVGQASADFGFQSVGLAFTEEDGSVASQAGFHPFEWTTRLAFDVSTTPEGEGFSQQSVKDLRIQLPPGLVAAAALAPHCPVAEFREENCPPSAAIGGIQLASDATEPGQEVSAVYNLAPGPGAVAELGFFAAEVLPMRIRIGVDSRPPYGLLASLSNASQAESFEGATLTILGRVGGKPFLTLPRSCTDPLEARFEADSWQQPGRWVAATAVAEDGGEPPAPLVLDGCDGIAFSPRLSVGPTAREAGAPTGLDLDIEVEANGLIEDGVPPQSEIRAATLTFPEGFSVNTAGAAGLGACSPADLERETLAADPGAGCPGSAKVGTVRVETPLLGEPLGGEVFVARPDDPGTAVPGAENPFDGLLALYVVVKSPEQGVLVKLPVEIEADPGSGRLVARASDLPQLPFSHLEVHLQGGPRSLLQSPGTCGTHSIGYRLIPWSGTTAAQGASEFSSDGGCAPGGFDPRLSAGTVDPGAGSPSPFVFDLRRRDGEQNVSRLSVLLPSGLTAKFANVPLCRVAAAAPAACPEASRIGSIAIATGVGDPLWLPAPGQAGGIYLSGPYGRSPYGLVAVVSAQAGPFDLGTVVVRGGIDINPRSGRATIELDPLPRILAGVPIAYRALHLELDRPDFIRNPTSCEPASVAAEVVSSQGAMARPTSFFQAAGCQSLPFEPKLTVGLRGPIHRGGHPGLRATVSTRGGEANVRRAALLLPATELLDSRRIRAVCDRVRFEARRCPARSVYGYARAWSPLLDEPLRGPVYLRAGSHKLPDLVALLGGPIDIEAVARVDSVRGRLRVTFQALPDLPLRKLMLTMHGGEKGLLVNTAGLCGSRLRAGVDLRAHSGKVRQLAPVVRTECRR